MLSGYLAVHLAPTAKAGPVDDEWTAMFGTMLYDGVLSSFLVHTRNLIDFFIGPGKKQPDDIVAAEFFQAPTAWAPQTDRAALVRLRARIAKRNAHLTYHRLVDKGPWNPREIVECLCDLRDQFNKAAPAYLIAVNVESLDEMPARPGPAAS